MKSETIDSFVNHFDGQFAYLKTLDFYFKMGSDESHFSALSPVNHIGYIRANQNMTEKVTDKTASTDHNF